jgi:hypothetical protein
MERNIANLVLPMGEVRETRFTLDGAGPDIKATALVRRKDYAGVGPVQTVILNAVTGVSLLPGQWQVQVVPPRGYYVSNFGGPRNNAPRPYGWNDVPVNRLIDLRETRSDMNGNYRFDGVAPGDYRILSHVRLRGSQPADLRRLRSARDPAGKSRRSRGGSGFVG